MGIRSFIPLRGCNRCKTFDAQAVEFVLNYSVTLELIRSKYGDSSFWYIYAIITKLTAYLPDIDIVIFKKTTIKGGWSGGVKVCWITDPGASY